MKKLLTALLILTLTTVCYAQTYTVERVIDGDTLKLTNGERVRLIGIDCPESKPNAKAQRDAKRTGKDIATILEQGKKATEFVRGFVKRGDKVHLEVDVDKRDKYGRLLAYVFKRVDREKTLEIDHKEILEGEDYFFINAIIIKAGYASPMTIPPNVKYAELFKKLYEEARTEGRGLWR